MAFLTHGLYAHADTPASDVASVDVTGRLPLHTACPAVDVDDLADALGPAWEVATRPTTVSVQFKVQHGHVFDVLPDTPSVRVYHQIRKAVHALPCDVDDDEPHAVQFVVRFVEGDPDSRVASLVDVAEAYQPTP